jgi:CO/xanthine dehydrogenase Mo-binding subunit
MSHASRREFLLAAGALLVLAAPSAHSALLAADSAGVTGALPPPGELDSWLAILPDGSVQACFGKMDMGHALEVAIAQIVAEELDVPVASVAIVMGDTNLTCNQGGASGSTGIAMGAKPLRNAAAEARRILLEAAATSLGAAVADLEVQDGVVSVRGTPGVRVTYASLVGGRRFNAPVEWNKATGNGMDIKVRATPKPPGQYRIVGTSVPRRDVAGKVFGTRDFVTDIRLPGMLHARMIRPPRAGQRIALVDERSLAALPDARVVREKELLAVVAEQEWVAIQAARSLRVTWSDSDPPTRWPGHDGLHALLRAAPTLKREVTLNRGDVDAVFAAATRVVEAEYDWPLQSHASMGPACALADVHADRATVWTGSQKPHSVRDGVAKLLALPPEMVRAVWVMGPGSYGRNDAGDAALDATWLSRQLGRPVRVQGMRQEGTAWDPKGPACAHRARAALDAGGNVVAYDFTARGLSRVGVMFHEADPRDTLTGMALGLPMNSDLGLGAPAESYGFAAKRLAWEVVAPLQERYSPLRTSHMRDPLGPEVHFGSEQFIDELAAAVHQDPVEFRLRYLTAPRDLAVVRAAAERAGWKPHAAPRRERGHGGVLKGRGISFAQRSDTTVAVIAEIEVYPATGRIWARRFTVAHDCGLVINPQGLKQTIEGNIVQGLSRTLFEEVHFDADQVLSVDWATYPILEMADAPEAVDVVMINPTQAPPSGAGEPTMRCVPAAVANAFFDATGVRLRRAPLTPVRVKAALKKLA